MTITLSRSLRNMKHVSTSRKSETDIKRLKSLKETNIVIGNDALAWTPEMFARAIVRKGLKPVPRKSLLSLRIDSDVLEWFRAKGRASVNRCVKGSGGFVQRGVRDTDSVVIDGALVDVLEPGRGVE
ncbi:MAG: BrnA antitoxin family protein, partial [Gammaproteobacteria bacterium]